ncbi:MAG: NAD-dependent epimerase/dehydratase family protein [Chloroflexi bacterium]|nr:NAD-dependent epimerase/dehydratase family protein [Chloroflexota bacterium]
MRIFVTGGTGFIGRSLVSQLIQRGDQVVCLVRDPAKAGGLAQAGAQLARGDVTNRAMVCAAMRGADVVMHLAAIYEIGLHYAKTMRPINVEGTRNVLESAAELGVPKIIHTSTVGVFGNTHTCVVDETYRTEKTGLATNYERTKWEAHYEVAVPLQKRGAPVIITQPGGVVGPGDTSPITQAYDFFLNRSPVMFGGNSGLTWAHVDDIAAGHILAFERGRPGEAYILAGPCLTYKQTFDLWSELTGIPTPSIWVPGWVVGAVYPIVNAWERAGLSIPISAEALPSLTDCTYFASADKAKRELGWQPRPIEEAFREVMAYEIEKRKKKK